jgi:hypothetical protein
MGKSNVTSNGMPKNDISEITTSPPNALLADASAEFLAIRAGVPIETVLNLASCYLGTAHPIASDAAEVDDKGAAWAAVYLIEMAKASIDSVIQALCDERLKRAEAAA